jgi:hypothetical protein
VDREVGGPLRAVCLLGATSEALNKGSDTGVTVCGIYPPAKTKAGLVADNGGESEVAPIGGAERSGG